MAVGTRVNWLQKSWHSVKQFTMRWSSGAGSWAMALLPRTRFNYAREVGDGTGSSVVMACVLWIARTFPEAPLTIYQLENDGTSTPRTDHPLVQLLKRPNRFYSGTLLWMVTLIDYTVSGNAYWLKVRSGRGRVVELWWTPHTLIEPRWPESGNEFISHYEYTPDPGRPPIRLEVDDIVHYRYGIDPRNTRKGLSPLASVLREIFTDDEAANFTGSLLRNLGIPGVIISPDPPSGIDANITQETAEAVKMEFNDRFSGDNRGQAMVMRGRTKVDVLSFSPEQMNLRVLRQIPEERVSAVLGIPAIVAGLGAGLSRSTFNNTSEAREMAYESNIIPTQRLLADEVEAQLLSDFGATDRLTVVFDVSGVRVLQEDENKRVERLNAQLQAGGITVAEYRSQLGYPTTPEHDIYLRPMSLMEIPSSGTKHRNVIEAKAVEIKQFTQADQQLFRRFQREAERHTELFATDLESAFSEVADYVMQAIEDHSKSYAVVGANGHQTKDVVDSWPDILRIAIQDQGQVEVLLPPRAGERFFQPVFEHHFGLTAETTFGAVGDRLGIALAFDLEDPVAREIVRVGGTRAGLVDVDNQTRQAIFDALADGREAGDGADALARRIRGHVEGRSMYPGVYQDAYDAARERGWGHAAAERRADQTARHYRSRVIARTETKYAQNISAVRGYEKSEVVEALICFDGDDCGVTSHNDAELANGRVFTFQEAEEYPLAHPQCVRSFAPQVQSI